ncbi:MAG: hypothetical protein VYD56_01500 [Bacteroidota bacterium]|jgi:hypothetical protein|nr:hypothetical protein [Bacteroidota bacterium]|tara:strand:- start:176 stop:631 length:456 start_codon:yes stop_codon:yes gene_type:complete
MPVIYFLLFSVLLLSSCTVSNEKDLDKTNNSSNTEVIDFDLKFQKISNNDFDNITQLLESLNQIPSSQRDILVENIKEEALKISKMTWPTKINSNSIKARYNVFFTNVSFLNSQNKLGITNNEELNLIKQINISWNVFVNEIQKTETQISD